MVAHNLISVLGLSALCLVVGTHAVDATGPQGLTLGTKVTIEEGTQQLSPPALQFSPSGSLHVAWFEKQQDKRVLRAMHLTPDGRASGASVQVNTAETAPESLHQAPGLSAGVGDDVFLTWATAHSSDGNAFATDLVLARSKDGLRFDRPIRVNDDGKPISHSFEQVLAGGNDVYVAWLDSRNKDKSGAATIFACSHDGGQTIGKNLIVDGMACPCCRPSMALAPDGSLWMAWRKTFDGNVRDIVLAKSTDRGRTFSPPVVVHRDGWAFPACPHRGPSLGFDKTGRLYIGWYTEGTDEQPRLLFSTSDDQGQTFSMPYSLHTSTTSLPDQLRMAVHSAGVVIAVWEEVTGVRKRVAMRTSLDRGTSFGPVQVLSEGAKAETPIVTVHETGALAVSWTEHAWPNNRLLVQFGRVSVGPQEKSPL